MDGSVVIFGREIEYDFLSGWIKYNRLQNQYSLEALAYGICSTSHLSYFENGRKKLRGEIIESLLNKLNINSLREPQNIGLIRQKFYNMIFQIESLNYEGAKLIYDELMELQELISLSPYNIEYKIYQFMYNAFVGELKYSDLEQDIHNLDKIYTSMNNELKYLYMFASGKIIYFYKNHSQGIERLETAQRIKDTPFINYYLGFSYCFNNEYLKGTYSLEKALESYQKGGRYINAIWCHNYLGICYSLLKLYERAESHYFAVLTGANHFKMDTIYWHLYNNLTHLHFSKGDYKESLKWVQLALEAEGDPILTVCNYVDISLKLNMVDKYTEIFNTYLTSKYENSKYYNYLRFQFLSIFHFDEDIFYREVMHKILPYYEKISSIEICNTIKLKLIEHLENKRKYKEANKIYKALIRQLNLQ